MQKNRRITLEKIDILDGTFEAQCERIRRLVESDRITPDLGSIMLSYYALGRNEAAHETADASSFAKENFNPDHDKTMAAFRLANPAQLKI